MEIINVTYKEYQQLFPAPISVFNTVTFSELNKDKCIAIYYLAFRDTKIRLGLILGEKEDAFYVPFSASYGGFSFNTIVPSVCYDKAIAVLKVFIEKHAKPLFFTPAPAIYNVTDYAKTISAIIRAGGKISCLDYNQHFVLSCFKNYVKNLDSKIRNKLNNALKAGFSFIQVDGKCRKDVARVYDVIRINHKIRGYPLHMSLQNILDTTCIVPADFFVVENRDGKDVAAAIIFHTTEDIYQVVYWGDVPEYSHLRSMNYLSYKIFEYYYNKGIKILDIGISTERGIPNHGLCEFKENIGCEATIKYVLKL